MRKLSDVKTNRKVVFEFDDKDIKVLLVVTGACGSVADLLDDPRTYGGYRYKQDYLTKMGVNCNDIHLMLRDLYKELAEKA